MNPFELQSELVRQWLGVVGLAATGSTNAAPVLSQQTTNLWRESEYPAVPWPGLQALSWPWSGDLWSGTLFSSVTPPGSPWQLSHAISPNPFVPWLPPLAHWMPPFALWMPWSAWSMPQWPWGQSPWLMSFAPWSFSASPWPFAGLAGSAAFGAWPFLSCSAMPGSAAPLYAWQPTAPTASDMLNQVAAAYQTASGHAVASVLGSIGPPMEARTYGQPWWHVPTLPGYS